MLSLLPLREWLYIGAISALIAALVGFALHERHIQAVRDAAADARVAQAQQIHNQEIENVVAGKVAEALAAFKASELQPITVPAPLTHLVCYSRRGSQVPTTTGTTARSDGNTAVPGESDVPFNPAAAIIQDGRDADAQVTLLQAYVKSCQDAGICAR